MTIKAWLRVHSGSIQIKTINKHKDNPHAGDPSEAMLGHVTFRNTGGRGGEIPRWASLSQSLSQKEY